MAAPGPGYRIRDRYELHEIAGRGGMAIVWRATQYGDAGFQRTVAVKQMHDHLVESPLYVDMFAEEARVLASMNSPNVATIYDFVAEQGAYFLVMEWIEGIDLGTYVHHFIDTEGKTRWDLISGIGIGMMRGLAAAHERRAQDGQLVPVVHRDVSPHNILITTEGQVKVIDFGLSLARDRTKELTEPGIVKGKMSYLSPEIVAGRRPSPLSDQFAAGSVLWEALVGRKLFEGQNDYEIYKKMRDCMVQPLRPLRRDVPRELAAVVHRALAAEESQRFASAREMATHLAQVLRTNRAPRDMHEILGQTVTEARVALSLGNRTAGEVSTTTPVADIDPVTAQMQAAPPRYTPGDATPPAGYKTPPPGAGPKRARSDTQPDQPEERKGLLHKIPFFWKR